MSRQQGYGVWTDDAGKVREMDTVQCCHCQRHIFVKPMTLSTVYLIPIGATGRWVEEPGAWCRNCHAAVCLLCHEHGVCVPVAKQMDQADLEVAQRDIRARLGWH